MKGSCLTHERLARLPKDDHSSLLRKLINYGYKSFIALVPERVEHGGDDAAGEHHHPADEQEVCDADEKDAS